MAKAKKSKLKIALIIVAIWLVVTFTVGMIVTSSMMADNFSRGDYSDQRFTVDYYYEHYQAEYPRTEVEFQSGDNTLKGFIYGADNDKGLLVFAHGIGSGHEEYMKELLWFVDNDWRVFTYDATGSGHSEGGGTRGLPQSALDLDAALTFAESDERLNSLPVFLMGHSWGGYATAAVLNFDHKIAGAASISGYNEPIEMILEWTEDMMGGFRYAMLPFVWIYNKALFGKNSGLTAVDGINRLNKPTVPVLIIHGTEDGTIGYDKSSIISEREHITNPNTQYITLDGGGHSNIFYTKEALEYINEFNKDYRVIYDQYNGDIPEDVLEEIYSGSDRELINTPNEELLSQIESFFMSCPSGN
ncbi:MAG: alpha/beta hydrolase [Ruminococcaceae bacterium]|nr:alpha/beta hydrolase [Oscillospiraceae bacterium]